MMSVYLISALWGTEWKMGCRPTAMDQLAKSLLYRPEDVSLSLRTHIKVERTDSTELSSDLHTGNMACEFPKHTH